MISSGIFMLQKNAILLAFNIRLASNKVNYCNGIFTGLPKKAFKQLQLVQNAVAGVLMKIKRTDYITQISFSSTLLLDL